MIDAQARIEPRATQSTDSRTVQDGVCVVKGHVGVMREPVTAFKQAKPPPIAKCSMPFGVLRIATAHILCKCLKFRIAPSVTYERLCLRVDFRPYDPLP